MNYVNSVMAGAGGAKITARASNATCGTYNHATQNYLSYFKHAFPLRFNEDSIIYGHK